MTRRMNFHRNFKGYAAVNSDPLGSHPIRPSQNAERLLS